MPEPTLIRTDTESSETAPTAERGGRATRTLREVRFSMSALAWWVVCLCLAVAFLYPLWVMLSMALKDPAEQGRIPPTLFPHAPTLANFKHLASVQGLNVFGNLGEQRHRHLGRHCLYGARRHPSRVRLGQGPVLG